MMGKNKHSFCKKKVSKGRFGETKHLTQVDRINRGTIGSVFLETEEEADKEEKALNGEKKGTENVEDSTVVIIVVEVNNNWFESWLGLYKIKPLVQSTDYTVISRTKLLLSSREISISTHEENVDYMTLARFAKVNQASQPLMSIPFRPPPPSKKFEHVVRDIWRCIVIFMLSILRSMSQPGQSLYSRIFLSQGLIFLRLPHKLHALKLHQSPKLVCLEVLCFVLRWGMAGSHQQGLEQALRVCTVFRESVLFVPGLPLFLAFAAENKSAFTLVPRDKFLNGKHDTQEFGYCLGKGITMVLSSSLPPKRIKIESDTPVESRMNTVFTFTFSPKTNHG
ncbi:DNA ligase 4 [Striga asiatica]|uniref:DNA ligase 4 n=1 Tax=Striga asiatica TaxID=4170 RepID=A0A5A7PPB8_STRAF|nr:DNA ligase 4 [Striga asiatica]